VIDIDKKYFHELKGFLEPSECKSIRDKFFDLFEINKDTMEEKQEHRKHFFSLRNSDVFKKTSDRILKKFSDILDKELLHTYTYMTYYEPGAILYEHVDRPQSQYALNINIDKNSEWPIFLKHPENNEISRIDQNPGDAFIYKGSEVPHFRPRLKKGDSLQFMIFAVEKNSEYEIFAGDKFVENQEFRKVDYPNKEKHLKMGKFYAENFEKGIDINEEYLRSLGL